MSSDSAHNQVSAIRKLIATFMLHNGGHTIYAIKCQKRKNYEEDLEMDKKILNRRLVYEPTVPRKKRKDF